MGNKVLFKSNFSTIKVNLFYLSAKYTFNLVVYEISGDNGSPLLSNYNDTFWVLNPKYHLEITSIYKDEMNNKNNRFKIDFRNFFQFHIGLESIASEITSKDPLFYKDNNDNIKLSRTIDPIKITGHDCEMEMVIGVHTGKSEFLQTPVVIFYINKESDGIILPLSNFMNFKYFIDHLDVHNAAMNAIQYIKTFDNANIPSGVIKETVPIKTKNANTFLSNKRNGK